MVEEVTLDSSVFVSAFVRGEEHNQVARLIMKKVFDGDLHIVTSAIVPVEVAGAIARKASAAAAKKAIAQMQRWRDMKLIEYSELTEYRSRASAEVAAFLRVKGMDAIVIQTAKERRNTLVTFDDEMAAKAKGIAKVARPKAVASKLTET
jgi:predicted nucleic acid-binding protein